MSNNISSAEKITFWQLIEKTKIEIPIIQRDYAQGRKDKTEIRNNFLDALFKSLEGDNHIELDFIYGSEQADSLQPLDGQQRLTTLFLLHWYIASAERKLIEAKRTLQKFTYETRISSREFCNQLVEHGIDFNNCLQSDIDDNGNSIENSLSKTIIDSPWFFLSWKRDPTIDAMLTMLDAIDYRYRIGTIRKEDLWHKLTAKKKSPFCIFC